MSKTLFILISSNMINTKIKNERKRLRREVKRGLQKSTLCREKKRCKITGQYICRGERDKERQKENKRERLKVKRRIQMGKIEVERKKRERGKKRKMKGMITKKNE